MTPSIHKEGYYVPRTWAEIERLAIQRAMRKFGGNKNKVALELDVSLKTVYNKLAAFKAEGKKITYETT